MPYVSAKYMPDPPLARPGAPKQIQAIDEQGQIWSLTEDSQVGDWLRYIEEGGTIDPIDTTQTKPAPGPGPAPLPAPIGVPRAQPDVVYDMPPESEPIEEKPAAKKPAARKPAKRKPAKRK